VHHRLPLKEGVAASYLIFGKGVRQHSIEFKKPPSLIFNQIADPDTHRGALERCVELCEQVNTTVINHPRKVLETSRDQVSQKLQGIPGVVMPRTQRFQPRSPEEVYSRAAAEDFDFPFIVRVAGLHGGVSMIRVQGREDLPALHSLPFDGREFYLTEFIEHRDADGYYHKQRIAVIDGKPILRHWLFNRDWLIHGSSRDFMLQRESWDEHFVRTERLETESLPGLESAIGEIARRMGLEYFGIDGCVLPSGDLVVFEANANMNILHNPYPEMEGQMRRINSRVYDMLTRYSGEQVI
jgi:glutathione synthase/RimK-type ligase-like ATP-grasp enzyme